MPSEDDIGSFIEAYRQDFGETISREEAAAARRVLAFFELLATDPEGGTASQAPVAP